MKRTLSSLAVVAVAAAAGGGLLLGGTAGASASKPPFEPTAAAVGSLEFFNAAGHRIYSGSTASPVASFVLGTKAVRAGDKLATLYGYKPVKGEDKTRWSGLTLSASTAYPDTKAPGALKSSKLPLVAGSYVTVAQLAKYFPTTTAAGYKNVYQLRVLTSAPQAGVTVDYDAADIQIVGNTWKEIYPVAAKKTTATLTVSKTSITVGGKVTLTAKVTAKVAGVVEFLDGATVLKKVTVKAAKASLTTAALPKGTQKVSAEFVPTATTGYGPVISAKKSVVVKAKA